MIQLTCPLCLKVVTFPDGEAGQLKRCPQCNEIVRVPYCDGAKPPEFPTEEMPTLPDPTVPSIM